MAMQSQGLRQVQKQTQSLVLAPQLRQSLKIFRCLPWNYGQPYWKNCRLTLSSKNWVITTKAGCRRDEPSPDEIEPDTPEEFPEDPTETEAKESETKIQIQRIELKTDDLTDLDFQMNLQFSKRCRRTCVNILKMNLREKPTWKLRCTGQKEILF